MAIDRRQFLRSTVGGAGAVLLSHPAEKQDELTAEFALASADETTLLNPTDPFTSEVGQPGWRGRPTSNLVERARMTLEGALTQHIDDDGLPYFSYVVNYATGEVSVPAEHSRWDHISQTGRSVNAILCARDMTGDWRTGVENEHKIRKVMLSDFGDDGFNYDDTGVAMQHDQNRVLLGLTNWHEHTGGSEERKTLRSYGDKLVEAMVRTARKKGESWSMPGMFYSPAKGFWDDARTPGKHGRTIMPLVRYTKATGYEVALKLAERYANHVLGISDTFHFDRSGHFKGFGDEATHVHSVGATVSGLIMLGVELDRKELVETGRAIYEYGLKSISTDFGWMVESNPKTPTSRRNPKLRQTTCEGCCITDLIECAIYLARAGYPQYWGEAERYLRNHLFENQMTTVDWVKSQGTHDMQARMLGSFSARSSPNRLFDLYHPSGPIGCCNTANLRALHLAWKHGLERDGNKFYANLLFDRETDFAKLETGLPERGHLRVTIKADGDLYLRIPDWARHTVRYQPEATRDYASWVGPYQKIPGCKRGQKIVADFPLRRQRTEWLERLLGITYQTEWLGDTVVSISPPGNCFPLYERNYLL